MKKIYSTFILACIAFMFIAAGCSGDKKPVSEKQESIKEKKPTKLNTREAYENKIAELGISIYKGSEFVEVKKSNTWGGNVIVYNLSVDKEGGVFSTYKESYEKLRSYYTDEFKNKLKPNGWKESIMSGEDKIIYMKPIKIGEQEVFVVSISHPGMSSMVKVQRISFFYGISR